jgi:hypothetical protein
LSDVLEQEAARRAAAAPGRTRPSPDASSPRGRAVDMEDLEALWLNQLAPSYLGSLHGVTAGAEGAG